MFDQKIQFKKFYKSSSLLIIGFISFKSKPFSVRLSVISFGNKLSLKPFCIECGNVSPSSVVLFKFERVVEWLQQHHDEKQQQRSNINAIATWKFKKFFNFP